MKSFENSGPLAVCAVALLAAGCGGAGSAAAGLPGFVAEWGSPGRIDGDFVKPRVIDVLVGGNVVVIDRSGRVQTFDPLGTFVGKFTLDETEKGYPTGMTVGPDGNLWIAETHAYRVAVYTPQAREVLAFGRYGTGDGEFVYVTDVALSPQGKVYVSDFGGSSRVQEFDLEGRFVRKLGGTGSDPGRFKRPQALACGADGSLFVADAANHRIQKFSPEGALVGVYGSPGRSEGQLLYPYDLAVGPDGTVYIAEHGNCRVQRMTPDGRFTGTWAAGGRWRLANPWGVAVDGGRLYVLDTGNSRVLHLEIAALEWSTGERG